MEGRQGGPQGRTGAIAGVLELVCLLTVVVALPALRPHATHLPRPGRAPRRVRIASSPLYSISCGLLKWRGQRSSYKSWRYLVRTRAQLIDMYTSIYRFRYLMPAWCNARRGMLRHGGTLRAHHEVELAGGRERPRVGLPRQGVARVRVAVLRARGGGGHGTSRRPVFDGKSLWMAVEWQTS
jgi:hypothetical protein